jgi:hypothetical protein
MDADLLAAGRAPAADLLGDFEMSRQLDTHLNPAVFYLRLYARYLQVRTFIDLADGTRQWLHPKPLFEKVLPDGEDVALDKPGGIFARDIAYRTQDFRTQFTGLSDARIRDFGTLLEEASHDGAHVIVWITPVHPQLRQAMESIPSLAAAGQKARETIAATAARYKADVLDLTDPASFGGDRDPDAVWADVVHTQPAGATLEIDRILAGLRTDGK